MKRPDGRSLTVVATGGVIVALLAASVVSFFYSSRFVTSTVIADDVKKIAGILNRINESCVIMSIDAPKSTVNFLNVKAFAGSEVGSINLTHPEKWEGPYLQDNLSVQGIEYVLVRTKKGSFVVPGDGVKLPNRAVIGKDIIIVDHTDIEALMNDPKKLSFKGQPLAAKIGVASSSGDLSPEIAAMEE